MTYSYCRVALALSGALVLVSPALAQTVDPSPTDPVRFRSEIVVTPERGETPRPLVPASIVVLEQEAIRTLPAIQLPEIIRFLAGFNAAGAFFHAERPVVSARGFFGGGEADYVLLLVDGVPAADVESALVDWSVVPTSAIRRVEGLRGPGASLYGDSAVAGVIQVFTDRQANAGQVTATGGSFGTAAADAGYVGRVNGGGFGASAAARRTSGAFDHSGANLFVGNGSVDGGSDRFSWRWTGGASTRERDDPGSLSRSALQLDPTQSDALFRLDGVDRRNLSTAVTLRHSAADTRLQGRLFVADRDEDSIRTILLVPTIGDRRQRALETGAIGGSVEGERTVSAAGHPILVRGGIDVSRERLETSYRAVTEQGAIGPVDGDIEGHRTRLGAFGSASWDPVSRVRVSTGLRWDDVDDGAFLPPAGDSTHRAWSPRVGAVVQLNSAGTLSAFSQLSRAFKAPTLDQRFDPRPYPDFRGGSFNISNPDLVPQRAVTLEAGVSGGGLVQWSALAYRTTVDDELDFDVRTFQYANIRESRHVGIELEAATSIGNVFRPSASYALTDVVNAGGGNQLKNIPRHRFDLGFQAELPRGIGVSMRYWRSYGAYLDDDNVFAIDGPSTLDFRARYAFGTQTSIFVDALNVTNDTYEEYGFTLTDFVGRTVPYAYPGAPRAVRVGVTRSF